MRPIRTIAPLALGLVALAVAGCQRPSDQTTTAAPTPTTAERTITTTPTRHPTPPPTPAHKPTTDSGSETIVALWPVKTLAQAKELQDSVDAGHQPWRLSAESVALAYAQGELQLFAPYADRGGPGRLPGPLPPRRVGGHRVPGPTSAPRQRDLGRDPGRGPGELNLKAPSRNLVRSASRRAGRWIGLSGQIAADLLPEESDPGAVDGGEGL